MIGEKQSKAHSVTVVTNKDSDNLQLVSSVLGDKQRKANKLVMTTGIMETLLCIYLYILISLWCVQVKLKSI